MLAFPWRDAAMARGLRLTDLAEHVGTAVEGLDLAGPPDPALVRLLRIACAERVVLVFPGQEALRPAADLGFARAVGGTHNGTTAWTTTTRFSSWATWRKAVAGWARRASG